MKFRVIKASLDGICGGDSDLTIQNVCDEICWHRGWDSLKQLHADIKKWGKVAKPGQVFKAAGSAVVATGGIEGIDCLEACPECDNDNLDYGELDPVEGGNIEQIASCPNCGRRWKDVFTPTERRELSRGPIAT